MHLGLRLGVEDKHWTVSAVQSVVSTVEPGFGSKFGFGISMKVKSLGNGLVKVVVGVKG